MALISVKPRLWSRSEYYQMAEIGFFDGERVELIRGEVVPMSPHDPLHSGAVENSNTLFSRLFGERYAVRIQLPLSAPDQSEPEPDVVLTESQKAAELRRQRCHPSSATLVVEVANTSLQYDRLEKGSLYAQAEVPDYWIVNLQDFLLEVNSQPCPDQDHPFGWAYREKSSLNPDDTMTYLGRKIPVGAFFLDLLDSTDSAGEGH